MVAITVGVACCNAEAWLEDCVGSLFGQTFDDFEIVAIDDGTPDSLVEAATFVQTVETRQNQRIAVSEELATLGRELGGNGYGEYLLQLAEETGPPAPAVAMTDDSV